MESNYSNKDFEQYVKQNADQYRMFPSDKVWRGVNNVLHTRRKWYGFWLGFLLLMTGGAVTWVMTTYPSPNKDNIAASETLSYLAAAKQTKGETPLQQDIKTLLPFSKESAIAKDFLPAQKNSTILPPVGMDAGITAQPVNDAFPVLQPSVSQIGISQFALADRENIVSSPVTLSNPPVIEMADVNLIDRSVNNKGNNIKAEDYPWLTIESVTNAYQYKKAAKKISWQLFITPTVSYRKLSVNKSMDNPAASNYPFASLADVNSAVTHKPDMGLQIGVSGRYPLTKSLKVRGGLQFNINRYDIKAYAFNGEVATIDLNGGTGNSSISTWTYYRNFAGYKSNWLKNYYFSVSVPVGLELKLLGNHKTSFGIAGTLQPTYILKDRAYLISTDYKNYAEVPRLVRHVNLNTSFETFINYTSGKTKWQIGPQVRYQILSSFHNTYPVKENLFDFGVKVGVTLNE